MLTLVPADVLGMFAIVSLLLCVAPGPDNVFVLAQSALHGARAGLLVTLGLCTGLVVHTAVVALGLAAMLKASPLAFDIIRYAGATYLLWLAWQTLRAAPLRLQANDSDRPHGWRLYRRGIIMNVTNPKVTLFFLALLPQFADPVRGPVMLQILLLGLVFLLSTLWVFGAVAVLAGHAGAWLQRTPRAQQVLHVLAAVVYVVLALRLLAGW